MAPLLPQPPYTHTLTDGAPSYAVSRPLCYPHTSRLLRTLPVSAVPSLCRALLTLPSVAKNIFLFQTHAPRSPPTGSLPTSTHLAPEVTFFSRAQAPSLSLQSPQGLADTQYMFVNCFMNKTAVSSLEECYKTHMDEVILG